MNWYNVQTLSLLNGLLPSLIRGQEFTALNEVMAAPIQELADELLYKMQHDSTVISLEKVLNEFQEVIGYDPSNHVATRQIYIEDGPVIERDWLFQENENQPKFWFLESENQPDFLDVFPAEYYHFIVWVPMGMVIQTEKFRAVLDYYKLAGKKYKIQKY